MTKPKIKIPPRIDWDGNKAIPASQRYAATYNQASQQTRLKCFKQYKPLIKNGTAPLAAELFTEDGNYAECWLGDQLIGLCNFSMIYSEAANQLTVYINGEFMINSHTIPFKNPDSDEWFETWYSGKQNYEQYFIFAIAGIAKDFLDQFNGKDLPKVLLDADIDSDRENFWLHQLFGSIQCYYTDILGGKPSKCSFECDW